MANGNLPDWFRGAVGEGIQRLIAVGLPGGPGWDSSVLTAQAWADTLYSANIAWDDALDAERLQTAFIAVARRARRWPTPAEVLEAMPPRPERAKIAAPKISHAQQQRARRQIRALANKLKHGNAKGGTA